MSEDNKIKTYIGQKVASLVEDFLKTMPERIDYQRNESAMKHNDYCWMMNIGSSYGRLSKLGFDFLGSPDRVGFYTVNPYGVHVDYFIWEYPNRLVDVFSRTHPYMPHGTFMTELWKYFDWEITKGNIQSEYKRFLATLHHQHQNEKIELNTRYDLVSMSPSQSYEKANRVIVGLKELSASLETPMIISESQSRRLSDYNGKKITIMPDIKSVFFNEVKKTTTVVFNDHTSVIVKCTDNDRFDPEVGLAMALTKKLVGSRSKFQKLVDEWVANSAPKNEQLKKKAARKAEREAAKIEHAKAQAESYME
jgi:hypothetical protein